MTTFSDMLFSKYHFIFTPIAIRATFPRFYQCKVPPRYSVANTNHMSETMTTFLPRYYPRTSIANLFPLTKILLLLFTPSHYISGRRIHRVRGTLEMSYCQRRAVKPHYTELRILFIFLLIYRATIFQKRTLWSFVVYNEFDGIFLPSSILRVYLARTYQRCSKTFEMYDRVYSFDF